MPKPFFSVSCSIAVLSMASAAIAQEELNALVWCDHTDPALIEPFEKAHNVKVNLREYEGTGTALALLEQSRPGDWDVLVIDGIDVFRAVEADILAPLPEGALPVGDFFPQVVMAENNTIDGVTYAVTEKFGYNTISYNSAKVDAADMESLQSAWSEKYAGRIAMSDYYLPVVGLATLANGIKTAELGEGHLDTVFGTLEFMRAQAASVGSVVAVQTALATGEVDIVVGGGEWLTAVLAAEQPEMTWTIPKEGAVRWAEILVHSNLDDGYAGLFRDLASAFGMVLIEKYIVEDLVGASASFCFGHHFSDPLTRAAFLGALAKITKTPGTMLFGNTVSYTGGPVQNYASLSSYLLTDIVALNRFGTGHAINPVPVTENQRIPDMDEILDAQLFAGRLQDHAGGYDRLFDFEAIAGLTEKIHTGGRAFADRVLAGLGDRGVDITDPAALMLAIRRLGAKRLENLWGGDAALPSGWAQELDERAADWAVDKKLIPAGGKAPTVVIGTTDVHEHGAYLVIRALTEAGVNVVDAGTSIDPEELSEMAIKAQADAVAISTYNGMGLSYVMRVQDLLAKAALDVPVLVGGVLNQVPDDSNSGLPVDVTDDFRALGAIVCRDLDDMLPVFMQNVTGSDA